MKKRLLKRLQKRSGLKILLSFIFIISILTGLVFVKIQSHKSTETNPNKNEQIREIAKNLNDRCKPEPKDCYVQAVRVDLLDRFSTKEILDALYDYDTYFSCHAFTHFVGRGLYEKLQSIPDAYSQIDFTCHGGTYHGVMEAYLDQRKTTIDEISGKDLEEICSDSPKKSKKSQSQIFTECLHGFGHAFMFITDSDLPKSLAYCDRLDQIYQERCWGGAFMENSTSSTNSDHPTAWLRENDKFYPCTILADHYLGQCYFYQANYLLKVTGRDWNRVFSDCGELEKAISHDYCILGMGAQLASVSNEQGINVAAGVCKKASSQDDAYICIEGAVPSLFARYGGDAPQIFEFCQKTALFLREFCFAKLGSVAKTYWQYESDQLQTACNQADQFKNACLGNTNKEFKY